jgi:hypothetical protein
MPDFNFGEKTNADSTPKIDFLRLDHKDQKLHLRFLPYPGVYEGKHFIIGEDGKWNISYCPKIMKGKDSECIYCDKYWEAKRGLKEIEDTMKADERKEMTVKEKALKKSYDEVAKKYGNTISFYYRVIDRDTGQARIFKTTRSVRIKLEDENKAGIEVPDYDYIITRTERPGSDYYSLIRLDSSKVPELTHEELLQIEVARKWDLNEMVFGSRKSSFDLGESVEEEDYSEYDDPIPNEVLDNVCDYSVEDAMDNIDTKDIDEDLKE